MKESYYKEFPSQRLQEIFKSYYNDVEIFLSENVSRLIRNESGYIREVYEPALYSLLNGGKRFRSIFFLLLSGYDPALDDGRKHDFLLTAGAIEVFHTYTLIHDDLPAMDNDDLRRGKPACHRVFPEWAAILAGDSLNTLAFYLLTLTKERAQEKIRILARYGGIHGLILGQALDLSNEKQDFPQPTKDFSYFGDTLRNRNYFPLLEDVIGIPGVLQLLAIHYHKTAVFFRAIVEMAMVCGRIRDHGEFHVEREKAYIEYGEVLGLLFQITDDILDETGTEENLGKKVKKDKKLGKLTFPGLLGLEKSYEVAGKLTDYAAKLTGYFLPPFTGVFHADVLEYLPHFLLERKS